MNSWFEYNNEDFDWRMIYNSPPEIIGQRIPRPITPLPFNIKPDKINQHDYCAKLFSLSSDSSKHLQSIIDQRIHNT